MATLRLLCCFCGQYSYVGIWRALHVLLQLAHTFLVDDTAKTLRMMMIASLGSWTYLGGMFFGVRGRIFYFLLFHLGKARVQCSFSCSGLSVRVVRVVVCIPSFQCAVCGDDRFSFFGVRCSVLSLCGAFTPASRHPNTVAAAKLEPSQSAPR